MNNRATYSYTAGQQGELDALNARYGVDLTEDALPRAWEIDSAAARRAARQAIALGIAALLTFGGGLSAVLTVQNLALGIPLGAIGIAAMIVMPAIYERMLKCERRKAQRTIKDLESK